MESWQGQAAGATSVVGKAVLTLYPPLRPLSHNVNPRDGAQDITNSDSNDKKGVREADNKMTKKLNEMKGTSPARISATRSDLRT